MPGNLVNRAFLWILLITLPVPCIHPISNFLLINIRQRTIGRSRHKGWIAINSPCFNSVPTAYYTCICIKILTAIHSSIQMTGATIPIDDLFYQCILRSIIQYGNLCGICTSVLILNGDNIIAGRQVGKTG